jgi:hypothetical protein
MWIHSVSLIVDVVDRGLASTYERPDEFSRRCHKVGEHWRMILRRLRRNVGQEWLFATWLPLVLASLEWTHCCV